MLHSERLILREWRESDLGPYAAMNADPQVREFFPSVLSRAESDAEFAQIQKLFQRDGFCFWAVEHENRFIGMVGLTRPSFHAHFTPCVEIGWRLAVEAWGQGFATEGARVALRYGFDELGLNEIVSFTTVSNERSQRVMKKLGMRHDPAEDFDHPKLNEGHPLRRHVLYRLQRNAFANPSL